LRVQTRNRHRNPAKVVAGLHSVGVPRGPDSGGVIERNNIHTRRPTHGAASSLGSFLSG
jgi:hypothetical protein